MTQTRSRWLLGLGLIFLLLITGCVEPVSAPPLEKPSVAEIPAEIDGIAVITQAELPPEAHETLRLIKQDGPFPYSKDGSTFQNREKLLPLHPQGYYSEYTVKTPGSPDRGARRIVAGAEGEFYYTEDHYNSFKRIWEP